MGTTVSGSSQRSRDRRSRDQRPSNAAPSWPVDRCCPHVVVRWRRCSTTIAMMLALAQIPRAAAAPAFKPPRLVRFVEAVLPAAPAARREGEVVLSLDVDETGKVGAVEVAKPAGGEGGEVLDRA